MGQASRKKKVREKGPKAETETVDVELEVEGSLAQGAVIGLFRAVEAARKKYVAPVEQQLGAALAEHAEEEGLEGELVDWKGTPKRGEDGALVVTVVMRRPKAPATAQKEPPPMPPASTEQPAAPAPNAPAGPGAAAEVTRVLEIVTQVKPSEPAK